MTPTKLIERLAPEWACTILDSKAYDTTDFIMVAATETEYGRWATVLRMPQRDLDRLGNKMGERIIRSVLADRLSAAIHKRRQSLAPGEEERNTERRLD